MECFGDAKKLPLCSDSFRSLTTRFTTTRSITEILITESANVATKYDLEQAKALQSWSFSELNKLLLPLASYNSEDETEILVGLHSGNILHEWVWSDSNELKYTYKKSFRTTILAILTFPSRAKVTPVVVVFANGHAEYLHILKEDFDEGKINGIIEPNEQIIGIDYYLFAKNSIALYYVVKSKEGKFVYKLTLSTNSNPSLNTIEKAPLEQDIQVWAFNTIGNNFIGALKKDSQILIYSLEPETINKSLDNLILSLGSKPADKICSISCSSHGVICVLSEKPSTGEPNFQLQAFEAKYGTKLGDLNITKLVLTREFCVIRDHAFVFCKNNVIALPILKQNVLLSKLLTKNLTENRKNYVKSKNADRFNELVGIQENEVLDLAKLKAINEKFETFIQQSDDVPEEMIVIFFNFCTRNYLKLKNNSTKGIKEKEKMLAELEQFFSSLIQLPYNEIFLISCLKSNNIEFEQCLLAIELLLKLSLSKDCSIISWISALLDTYFCRFIIKPSSETQATLNRIYDYLNRCIRIYEDLGPIKTIFDSLVNRDKSVLSAISNETTQIGQYSIELLSFT